MQGQMVFIMMNLHKKYSPLLVYHLCFTQATQMQNTQPKKKLNALFVMFLVTVCIVTSGVDGALHLQILNSVVCWKYLIYHSKISVKLGMTGKDSILLWLTPNLRRGLRLRELY